MPKTLSEVFIISNFHQAVLIICHLSSDKILNSNNSFFYAFNILYLPCFYKS